MRSVPDSFGSIYWALYERGTECAPRGLRTRELLNFSYTLPPYERFAEFPSRVLNTEYLRTELRWYLRGSLTDLSICNHAAIWKNCVTHGRLYSNYGYYLFTRGGLEYAVELLRKDPDSRRAVVPIYGHEHMFEVNNDVPCTLSISFKLRGGKLLTTVHMRSQDAIFGLGNDVPFFSVVSELAACMLEVPLGALTVFVESFHVYERHFDKLSAIARETHAPPTSWPRINGRAEAESLVLGTSTDQPTPFTEWLNAD